jgi:uncharacterized protein YndB with AHSA1/START domain
MAKKTKKNSAVTKASKVKSPSKKSPARSKSRPAKKAAPKKSKPARKSAKPAKALKPKASAIAKKKTVSKKAAPKGKPVSKTAKKPAAAGKKTVKPVKAAKTAKPSKPAKKAAKPAKATGKAAPAKNAAPAKKAVVPKAPVKTGKIKPEAAPKKIIAPAAKAEPKAAAKNIAPKKEEPAARKPAPAQPTRRSKRPEPKKPLEFNEDGTPVNLVKLNGKAEHVEPSRIVSAPIAPPKPVVMSADKKKEPKGKFELEYVVHASASLLFEFFTTPSGLSEWFADDVNIRQGIYTFFWDGAEQQAKLIGYKDQRMARYQWVDKSDGSYFEFRVEVDDLTKDVSLIITDFAEDPAEMATSKLLWDSQVNKLLHVIGAYT